MKEKRTVLVALSGGIDSSFAAYRLIREGYRVIGITMQFYPLDKGRSAETYLEEKRIADIKKIAENLRIPLYILNLEKDFHDFVIEYFFQEYLSGRTPNPCIICNQKIKFDTLLNKAREFQSEYIATGHYICTGRDEKTGRFTLSKGNDHFKDQSYFLFLLTQEHLEKAVTPLGQFTKKEVKDYIKYEDFKDYIRPESQEICFIQEKNYHNFIKTKSFIKPGNVVDSEGRVLGRHKGIPFYTIGQRRGLGISAGSPIYILSIDEKENTIIVGREQGLYKKELIAERVNWVSIEPPKKSFPAKAKIRYKHREDDAEITPFGENNVKVIFNRPQRAITPGQAVVFYKDNLLLGGGFIKKTAI
ncbi:MAG: tRNA 2-thiouridine(34) synthase MnmA [Thermodesulfobacteriota bacterium]|nr:tRNA 2-thiouridine(34) synthase MnmA [Thermodesulfobacteriota bacterium]